MRKRGRKPKVGKKMGRTPCCNKSEVKKGSWTPEEDKILFDYITKNGHGTWRSFPKLAGLQRCGKSCRLRWTNYLRPDIKRGAFSFEEEETIFKLHDLYGNKWAAIASRLPGRTDNEIKNYWNSHLRKRIPNRTENPPSKSKDSRELEVKKTSVDPSPENILRQWGCGVEDVFQKREIKVESDSFVIMSTDESCGHGINLKDEAEEGSSESQNSEDASDITLDLLLDFPNDGEYLEYV